MITLTEIIHDIQKYFISHEIDIAHNIGHHYRVWENSMTIVREEKLHIDSDAVQIAAWLHYIDNGKEKQFLNQHAKKWGLNDALREKVRSIVIEQSFGQEPKSIESKIVYDADRIELLSIPRWQFVFQSCEEGNMTEAVRDNYIARVHARIPVLKDNLHFACSNKRFADRLPAFQNWAAIACT